MKVKLESLIIEESRWRKDFTDINSLADSIKRVGLISPVVVRPAKEKGKWILVAGERRVRAVRSSGGTSIEARTRSDLNQLQARQLELEENVYRSDLTWQEQVNAVSELHKLKVKEFGKARQGARTDLGEEKEGWGMRETAKMLGKSIGSIQMDIALSGAMEVFPELGEQGGKKKAHRKYMRMRSTAVDILKARQAQEELGEKDNGLPYGMHHSDAVSLLKAMGDESVDFIILDPPWGIGIDKSDALVGMGSYEEDEVFDDDMIDSLILVGKVLPQCVRILRDDRHMVLFVAERPFGKIRKMCERHFDYVAPPLCVWDKQAPGKPPLYYPSPQTELFLVMMKGKRRICGDHSTLFSFPRVHPKKKIHPTEKPIELMRAIVETFTVPGEVVLDPMMGSGSSVRAAVSCGRRGIGCEINEKHYLQAVAALDRMVGGK